MENSDSRNCATCAYYLQFYIKSVDFLRYRSAYCGRCINNKIKGQKLYLPSYVCDKWEKKPDIKEQTLSEIKYKLALMARKIDFIAEILTEISK